MHAIRSTGAASDFALCGQIFAGRRQTSTIAEIKMAAGSREGRWHEALRTHCETFLEPFGEGGLDPGVHAQVPVGRAPRGDTGQCNRGQLLPRVGYSLGDHAKGVITTDSDGPGLALDDVASSGWLQSGEQRAECRV